MPLTQPQPQQREAEVVAVDDDADQGRLRQPAEYAPQREALARSVEQARDRIDGSRKRTAPQRWRIQAMNADPWIAADRLRHRRPFEADEVDVHARRGQRARV